MAGYISSFTEITGDTIDTTDFSTEFTALETSFSSTAGHKHDGTTSEGPVIGLIGDAGESVPNNKVVIDTANNEIELYVEVATAPVEQVVIKDGVIEPTTDNDIDLGSTLKEFKDLYLDGIAYIDSVQADAITILGNRVLTVADEGTGNGLDADTLDGLDSTQFLRSDASDSYTGRLIINAPTGSLMENELVVWADTLEIQQDTHSADAYINFHVSGDYSLLFGLDGSTNKLSVGGYSLGANVYEIWHAGNDGPGSTLDADLLDGYEAERNLRVAPEAMSGTQDWDNLTSTGHYTGDATLHTNQPETGAFVWNCVVTANDVGSVHQEAYKLQHAEIKKFHRFGYSLTTTPTWTAWGEVWHGANDGAGSGLDADLLDGQQGSYYLPATSYTAADVLTKLLTVDGTGSTLDADLLDGQEGVYYLPASSYTAADVLTKLLTVDGAASLLDADLLDGQQGAYYAPIASPALTGIPTAPTATAGTSTTQLATTAFVKAYADTKSSLVMLASPVQLILSTIRDTDTLMDMSATYAAAAAAGATAAIINIYLTAKNNALGIVNTEFYLHTSPPGITSSYMKAKNYNEGTNSIVVSYSMTEATVLLNANSDFYWRHRDITADAVNTFSARVFLVGYYT